jgi:VCBS repeat-containing protein
VLGNDTDADGDSLAAVKVSDPAHGTLTLNADGSFTYTPALNFSGGDSFAYKSNDGTHDSDTAIVSIAVTSPNDAPVAGNDAYATPEDTPLTINAPGVLGNDTDADGDSLAAVKVSDPAHGTLSFNADGSFAYTPAPDYNGADSFTYKANDGSADSNVAIVAITVTPVNDAPRLDAIGAKTVTEAELLAFTVHATDPEDDPIAYSAPNKPDGAHLDAIPGAFEWTPGCAAAGSYTVTFKATDSGTPSLSGEEDVTITVNPTNCPPALDPIADQQVTEGQLLKFIVTATDPDGDSVTLSAPGTLPLGATFTPASGLFSWRPRFDQAGTYSGISFRAEDPGGLGDTLEVTVRVAQPAGPIFSDNFAHGKPAGDPDWTRVSGTWAGGGGVWTARPASSHAPAIRGSAPMDGPAGWTA